MKCWGDDMKRFMMDGILVLILVGIGSTVLKEKPQTDQLVQYKIEEFEKEVEQQSYVQPKVQGFKLNQLKENKAGQLAKGTSETIVAIVDSTVEIIATLFSSVAE